MNQKKNRGFTLIELLAVIVILAIIALIAVPIIMNIISKANESAFKDTAYGIISAGELYFAEQLLEPAGMTSDVTMTLPDTRLQLKGDIPEGQITITTEGKVAIALQNGRYCITKGILDDDITVTEDIENCSLPSNNDEVKMASLKALAVATEDIVIPECVTNQTACAPGTSVAIKVNANTVYNFYVLNDSNNEVTLIMDRNLYSETDENNGNVLWINASDYAEANADDNTSCSAEACNDEGPITVVTTLKERTSTWNNIPERKYTYSDDGGGSKYQSFTKTMRARILTYTEAKGIKTTNNNTMPNWMYINLNTTGDNNTIGYWLSSADTSDSYIAHIVYCDGSISIAECRETVLGVRPVITLTK